jgi:hypothetical protein
MAHSTNDFFAVVEPVANRTFYGVEAKAERQCFSIFKESTDDEPIRSAVEFGGPASLTLKPENDAVALKNFRQGPVKTWNAAVWAGAAVVSLEAVKDTKNRYPKLVQAMSTLGRAARVTPELLTALFLDRAFDSSYPVAPDNLELCSTAHLLPDGVSTYANEMATPSAMSEAALESVQTSLRTMTGPDGNISQLQVKAWVVPSALHNTCMKLMKNTMTSGSANNDPSVVNGRKQITFDYLGSPTRYFALTDSDTDGLFWDWIEKVQFLTDQVPMMLQKAYVTYFRARYGCVDPRNIFGVAAT